MAIAVKFGSYTFPNVFDYDCRTAWRVPSSRIPRRHGALVETALLDPKLIVVQGTIRKTTSALARTERNDMAAVLNAGIGNLYFDDDRYVEAQPQNFNWIPILGQDFKSLKYIIEFFVHKPLVKSGTLTTNQQTITTNPQTYSVTNNGNAPAELVVTVRANAGGNIVNPKLTNQSSNKFWQYTGTITAGNILILNTENFTVVANGTQDLANFSGEFFLLKGGANNLKFEGGAGRVDIEFRDTYYEI